MPDWYKIGYKSKPIKAFADSNLFKSPHSPKIVAIVLSDTPGIDLIFSILEELSLKWLFISSWICFSISSFSWLKNSNILILVLIIKALDS